MLMTVSHCRSITIACSAYTGGSRGQFYCGAAAPTPRALYRRAGGRIPLAPGSMLRYPRLVWGLNAALVPGTCLLRFERSRQACRGHVFSTLNAGGPFGGADWRTSRQTTIAASRGSCLAPQAALMGIPTAAC